MLDFVRFQKAVGFQRVAELSGDQFYKNAANFFWTTVSKKRSLAIGGKRGVKVLNPATPIIC